MTNIITACFGGTQYANTRPAWLIDHGMVLQITGVELPETYFVDFANSKAEQATRVLGNADGVVIPDQYFLSNAPQIFAWVYLTTGNSGFTTLQVTIPLAQRPDVSTEPPTPQETDLIEQAIAALNDGVERAETAADDAEAAAANIQQTVNDALQAAKDSGEFDGTDGVNGVTFTPDVDAAGNISWTNDGGLPNPQTRNIKGPKGDKLTYADLTAADKADLVQGPIADAQTAAVNAVNSKGEEVLQSIPSDYTELSEDVDDLKSAFDSTIIVTQSNNLLDPVNILVGQFYKTAVVDGRTMMILSANAAYSCAFIDIVPGDVYSLSGISYAAYNGDADGYAIGVANSISNASVADPELDTANVAARYNNTDKTITRLYFSWRHATYPDATYMANKGELLPYEPFGELTRDLASDINVSSDSVTDEIYFVDLNGTGDFTSLMAAFVALKDNEKTKTIYVLSGEYDVYQEIGGDTFVNSIPSDASTYWDYVTVVPKNTKIIGVGGVVLKYLPETVPDIAAQFISPINISDGNVYMENIKIICKNCRYGIHDQTRNDHPNGYEHIYKNVAVLKDDANGYTGKVQAYGGGMNQGANLVFENCVFQSHHYAWSLHNAGRGYGNVIMGNCAFNNLVTTRNAYPSIRFGNVSGVQTHVNVTISGCYLNDGIGVVNESSVERPNAFDITMINCVGTTGINITTQTNIYTPQIFNA